MSIKGDMVASLVSKGMSWEEATKIVTDVIHTAEDQNFAYRFAAENDDIPESEAMSRYWDVVSFLKRFI